MESHKGEGPSFNRIGAFKRKALNLNQGQMVTAEPLGEGRELPLVVKPSVDGVNLVAWASRNREFIERRLLKHGAILFRDFGGGAAADLEGFIRAISGAALEYSDQTSPRHKVSGNIYTSTDHPADQPIFLHNENSYSYEWPMKLFLHCVVAPSGGGATPVADVRRVFSSIDPVIRGRFSEKGWMLVRNFGDGIGLPWQRVFQTSDRAAVEYYCRRAGISVEWRGGDRMRARQVRRAIVAHPRTGETVWFNHAAFFHVSTLTPDVREAMMSQFGGDELPYNTYYGDGGAIEDSALDEIRAAYLQESVRFAWEKGDILLVDNMLTAHGREPYQGERRVLVGMSEPFGVNQL